MIILSRTGNEESPFLSHKTGRTYIQMIYKINVKKSNMQPINISNVINTTSQIAHLGWAHRRRWLSPLGHQWPTHHTGGVLSGLFHCIFDKRMHQGASEHLNFHSFLGEDPHTPPLFHCPHISYIITLN